MLFLTTSTLRLLFYFISLLRVRWRTQSQISQCLILSLPDEVLSRVFHHLDCWGILAARLTCERLYTISRSRLLWQFKALEASYSSGVPLLEEPVENYTSKELEAKIITRARTSQRWRKPDPSRFQWRKIAVGYSYRTRYELKWLPGGRWVLLNLRGCVSIMDLDTPEPTREPLFDASDSADPLSFSTIWIDPTKCWLSPRIALHGLCAGGHEGSSRICIYQLNLMGRGSNMKWSAEEIATIRTPARGMKGELNLEKDYVLEGCMHHNDTGKKFKAHLYQYSDGPLRSCEWDWESKSTYLLLPKSRMGVVTPTHIKLFAIKPARSDGLELELTFCTLVDPIPTLQEIYRPYSTLHCSYFSIAQHDMMLEVQFPHDANEVHQKRITFAPGPIPTIKDSSLLVRLLDDCSIDFISYRPDEQGANQVASHVSTTANAFQNRPGLTACDLASGRLIMRKYGNHMLLQI